MLRVSINKKPVDGDTHTYLDYMELLALVNMDGSSTIDAAVDRYFDSPGGGRGDCQVEDVDGDADEDGGEILAPVLRRAGAARVRSRFSDAMSLATWRSVVYLEDYPFEVSFSGAGLKLKENLSDKHKIYLFVLVAANLPFVNSGRNTVTDYFEKVSRAALVNLMPAGSEVHIFGKANASRYSGTAFEKMTALCRDIRARMTLSEEDFRTSDTGDSGVDLVSWFGMGDEQPNILVCLGQCACSRSDWTRKQLAASSVTLSYIHAPGGWKTAMFVPICFRKVGGGWAVATDVASVTLVDRLRLMRNAKLEEIQFLPDVEALLQQVMASEALV